MKNRQNGFSGVETMLVIIIIMIIGGAGWYVFTKQTKKAKSNSEAASQNTTVLKEAPKGSAQNPTQEDETATWVKVDGLAAGETASAFSIKIPDGWKLTNYPGNTLNGNELTYQKGEAAVIVTEQNPYAGDQKNFNVTIAARAYGDTPPQWGATNPNGTQSVTDFSIGSLKGKKYSIVWNQSVTGVNKGDKMYQYYFELPNNQLLNIVYKQAAGSADTTKLIEQVIQTVTVK